jgi:hypothetical protein
LAADWPRYNEALVKRGEILLDILQSWMKELEEKYDTTDLDEIMSKELEGTEKKWKSGV